MKNYLFVLGNAPELAEEELASIWPNYKIAGGLIKVAEIFAGSVIDELIVGKKPGERVVFGISGDQIDIKAVKDELEERGFKARFILPKDAVELSSVVVVKQNVSEIYKIGDLTARTVWVQDFESWGLRDFGRPEADPHIGMLPPKVARMMVNVAAGETILDPFCGVGTILAETLVLGKKAIGSDINPEQIAKTKKNLDWLGKKADLFVADARKIVVPSVDAIVTETYLGPDDKTKLERLYYDSFDNWKNILKPGGKVVIATPFPLDTTKLMGYSLVAGPFVYFRSQARIRRHIQIFRYGAH